MKPAYVTLLALVASACAAVSAQSTGAQNAPPVELTAEQDHRRLLDLLHIDALRPGADTRNPNSPNAVNYDESRANPYPVLPEALTLKSGKPVKTAAAWWNERRAQIVEDFDREVYGRVPANVPSVRWEVVSTTHEKIGAIPVVTKQLLGHADNSAYPLVSVDIELSVTTPARATAQVPVIMELWFKPRPGALAPPPPPTGPMAPDWREQVLARGWGFALLTPNSIQADNGAGLTRGIIGLTSKGQPRKPEDWGALRAWAWGASRALDYLETDKSVDATRVAIEGLSRYGKAALVTMAYEPRFAVGFIGSSGAGGAKLHRRDFGERVENVASPSEYHWMAGNYLKYAGPLTAKDLPVDAHQLIALAAPRPLFIGVGSQDVEGGWVDARGMFMAAAAAGSVYRLLGRQDLGTTAFPSQETALVAGDLAFRQHSGGHTNGPNWPTFLSFADRYFSGRPLLSSLFHDRAVLQRDKPVRVWGWARPGENVFASVAGNTAATRANTEGRWIATLPAMKAGGPHVLTVRSESGASARSSDILVGDVWLCSGQSNMVLQVHRTLDARAEIARSANDRIRMLTLELVDKPARLEDVATVVPWLAASPATAPEFSAACFYFARELQKTVDVPMGLINSSWGGARIQTWMSEESLRGLSGKDELLDLLATQAKDPAVALSLWSAYWQKWWKTHANGSTSSAPGGGSTEPWGASPGISRDWRVVPAATGPWEQWGVPALAKYDGIVWYRTSFTLSPAQAAQRSTLSLGPVDEVDTTWVNGKVAGYTSGAGANRSYALGPQVLHAGENTIAIAALDTYATGGMLGTPSQRTLTLADGTMIPLNGEWRYSIAPAGMGPPPRAPWDSTGGMTTIYNAMIAPLQPYTLRGVAWYQGESNTEDAGSYGKLMTAWMADWRKGFESPELPFLIVQLANYGATHTAPVESGWAELRDAQRAVAARDKHAGLAITIDIGDRYDIHPANKQELGRRLARAARHVVYGESISPSGPVAKAASRAGNHIVVQFDHVEGRLAVHGARRAIGFDLCGAPPGTCQFAEGIADGNTVRIEVASGTAPSRVRYCWADSPVCTLYDESGLPAGPFELAIR
jgi:sialate O-acetylesterase